MTKRIRFLWNPPENETRIGRLYVLKSILPLPCGIMNLNHTMTEDFYHVDLDPHCKYTATEDAFEHIKDNPYVQILKELE